MSGITVIMPTYNCASYIEESIASISAQTVQPDEIIVIDDGSTDSTGEIVRGLGIRSLRYVVTENRGVSAARNHGLELANGNYVAFLDADDRWHPTVLEKQLRALQQNREIAFSFTNFKRFIHSTKEELPDQFTFYPELQKLPAQELQETQARLISGDAFLALVQFGEVPAYTQCMMFNRSLIADLRFDESLKICEDMEFVLRASVRGPCCYIPEVLVDVRRHGKNATKDRPTMATHKMLALETLRKKLTDPRHTKALDERLLKAYVDIAVGLASEGHPIIAVRKLTRCMGIKGSNKRKLKGAARVIYTAALYPFARPHSEYF